MVRPCNQCNTPCEEEHRFCPSCGFPIAALRPTSGDPLIGRTLGGGYTILEAIGAGGMGRVYRAEQIALGKTIAVKVIHPHLAGDENAVARFWAESRACSRINHPNAVSVLDFGRTDDNLLYLVMEFLRGLDLSRIVWEGGALPWARGAEIIRQVLAALSEAHERGVIHRDIKPENVLVEPLRTGGDFVKVVDFGLAKIRSDVAPGVTSPGLVCGTPDYMAPEQGRGLPPDPRSDLYSAAVVLYYTVTGRLPFDAELPQQVLLMHVNDPVPDPRTFVPDLPEHFVRVLLRGLEKDPDVRYQTAVEFAEALHGTVAKAQGNGKAGQTCARCGNVLAAGLKFCGECGARVGETTPARLDDAAEAARRVVQRHTTSRTASGVGVLAMVGRDSERERVEAARRKAAETRALVGLRVVGEEGAGKQRLVAAVKDLARRAGDLVVSVGPDPTWAGVPYEPVTRCVRALLGIKAAHDALAWFDAAFAPGSAAHDPVVRSGFEEIFTPAGAEGLDPRLRTEAALRAVAFAVREGVSAWGRPAFVVFEQLHRMDGASVRVLSALLARPPVAAACIVVTHTPRIQPAWPQVEFVTLRGLSRVQAREAASAARPGHALDDLLDALPAEVLPLHLEHALRWHVEGGAEMPRRLVDVISARLERLSMQARRVLQALAILGRANAEMVARVAGAAGDAATLRMLGERGWLLVAAADGGEVLEIAHSLVREVVDASVPATVRRELHKACVAAQEGRELALEVQAQHAEYIDDAFRTLLLLEKVGDRALARGDDTSAAQALRRGLELARREFARGETDTEAAIVIFTRKLGEALVRAGDFSEAEGVLREGLSVATRGTVEWAKLEGTLGRALCARGRQAEGLRSLDNAVSVASRHHAVALVVELLVARADMESFARDHRDAVQSLESADARLREALHAGAPADALQRQRAELLLRLARARRLAGLDGDGALVEARALGESLGLAGVAARCEEEAAERAESSGDRRAAIAAWQRAAERARGAGDAAREVSCKERLRLLGAAAAE